MFKFRIYVYIIPCNQCDDFQHPLPYSAPTSTFTFTFNTLFPIQHPLPLLHSIATNSMCCNLLSQLRSASFRALSSSPLAIFL